MLVNVSSKDPIVTSSEVGWISNSKLILALNNEYFLVNIQHKDMIQVENNIQYGKQHLNMKMFVSILKTHMAGMTSSKMGITQMLNSSGIKTDNPVQKNDLIKCEQSIQRMNIASFARFAFIR